MATDVLRSRGTRTAPLRGLLRTAALGSAAGVVAGFLVGGVGGRLAMRLLAVTSPAAAQGRLTDDHAVVGVISPSGTAFLVLLTTAIGAATGLGYLVARRVLPRRRAARVSTFAALGGCAGGALLVRDHPSFDFSTLQPEWLAVALFVAIPAVAGAVVAALAERWIAQAEGARATPWWRWVVGAVGAVLMVPILAVSPLATAAAGVAVVGAVAVATVPAVARVWHSRFVSVAGAAVVVALVVWGGYGLVADIVSLATDVPSRAPLSP